MRGHTGLSLKTSITVNMRSELTTKLILNKLFGRWFPSLDLPVDNLGGDVMRQSTPLFATEIEGLQ